MGKAKALHDLEGGLHCAEQIEEPRSVRGDRLCSGSKRDHGDVEGFQGLHRRHGCPAASWSYNSNDRRVSVIVQWRNGQRPMICSLPITITVFWVRHQFVRTPRFGILHLHSHSERRFPVMSEWQHHGKHTERERERGLWYYIKLDIREQLTQSVSNKLNLFS